MAMPHSILVAVDFGDASARAVSLAGALAARCNASLTLVHTEAAEAPAYFTSQQIASLEAERRITRAQANAFLTEFGHSHTREPFATIVDDGPAVDAILHRARGADLVAMGTHGRRGPKRWWLGSVAERVLREVARPLLVVRADTPAAADAAFRRAVVHSTAPLSGSEALAYARQIAGCFGGEAIDARFEPIEPALAASSATVLVAATPNPATAQWLANFGEPLVRHCRIPILFVPDSEGADK